MTSYGFDFISDICMSKMITSVSTVKSQVALEFPTDIWKALNLAFITCISYYEKYLFMQNYSIAVHKSKKKVSHVDRNEWWN